MDWYEASSSDAHPRLTKPGLVLLAVVGAAVSTLTFWSLRSRELDVATREFELDATRRIGRVQQELLATGERFRSLEALYASSAEVDEEEFRTFAARSLEHPALRAVVSIVPVAREEVPNSYFIEYRVGEESGRLPDDLGSEPRFAAALERSRELGGEVLSAPVLLWTETEARVLAVLPVFNRHREPRGMVGALWDAQGLIVSNDMSASASRLWIEDVTVASVEVLGGMGADPGESGEVPRLERKQEFGGRWWSIVCAADSRFIERSSTWWPWGGMLLGLSMTGLLVAAVATTTGRVRLHQLVASRTAEVRKAYGTLAEEAKERQWAVAETRELERQLSKIIDLAPGMVYVKDWYGRFLFANKATADAYGTTVQALSASRDVDLNTDVTEPNAALRTDRELIEKGLPRVVPASTFIDAQGQRHILRMIKIPCSFGQLGQALLCIGTDITDQEYAEDILQSQNRIIARLAGGASPKDVLGELVRAVEEIVPDMRCSVLLLGDDRRLHHCCAPHMPAFYNETVDGLPIGRAVGSCGAAAFAGERVVVADVLDHPNWADYRELAQRADIRACWSEPIRGTRGEILGTFAMYYAKVRAPEHYEEKLIESMAHLAGLAIERGSLGLVRA